MAARSRLGRAQQRLEVVDVARKGVRKRVTHARRKTPFELRLQGVVPGVAGVLIHEHIA